MTNAQLIEDILQELVYARKALEARNNDGAEFISSRIFGKSRALDLGLCSNPDKLHFNLRRTVNMLRRWAMNPTVYEHKAALEHLMLAREQLRKMLEEESMVEAETESETKKPEQGGTMKLKKTINITEGDLGKDPQLSVVNVLTELFPRAVVFAEQKVARYVYDDGSASIGHRAELSFRDVEHMDTFVNAQSENLDLNDPLPWYKTLSNLLDSLEKDYKYDVFDEITML